jgi:hypothetical protein
MTEKSSRQSAKQKRSPLFGFFAACLFISTGWVGLFGYADYGAHFLASEARVATATITKKVMHPAGEAGYTHTAYEIDFVFTTADGNRVEDKTSLTADHWDRIKLGDTFPVTYAASAPQTHLIGTDTSTTFWDLFFLGGLVIWLVFMMLTVRARHRRPTARGAAGSRKSKTASSVAPGNSADEPQPIVARASVSGPVLFATVLLLCGVIFLLIGVAILVKDRADDRAFRTEGKAATATVFTKSTVQQKHGTSYPLGIRFNTDAGQSVETVIHVDLQTMTSIHERDSIKIIYLPEHPRQIRHASDNAPSAPLFLWFICALGGIFVIGGVIAIAFSFFDAKRQNVPR